jgi:hypothetical protein
LSPYVHLVPHSFSFACSSFAEEATDTLGFFPLFSEFLMEFKRAIEKEEDRRGLKPKPQPQQDAKKAAEEAKKAADKKPATAPSKAAPTSPPPSTARRLAGFGGENDSVIVPTSGESVVASLTAKRALRKSMAVMGQTGVSPAAVAASTRNLLAQASSLVSTIAPPATGDAASGPAVGGGAILLKPKPPTYARRKRASRAAVQAQLADASLNAGNTAGGDGSSNGSATSGLDAATAVKMARDSRKSAALLHLQQMKALAAGAPSTRRLGGGLADQVSASLAASAAQAAASEQASFGFVLNESERGGEGVAASTTALGVVTEED